MRWLDHVDFWAYLTLAIHKVQILWSTRIHNISRRRWLTTIIGRCFIIVSFYDSLCLVLKSVDNLSSLLHLRNVCLFICLIFCHILNSIGISWWRTIHAPISIKTSLYWWLLSINCWKLFFYHFNLSLVFANHGGWFARNWTNVEVVFDHIVLALFLFFYSQVAMSFFYHLLGHGFVNDFAWLVAYKIT